MTEGRIARRFAALREEGRAGLVTFVTAGDPDLETSLAIVRGLPSAGADLIELGMPFSDPMADGPAIQASGQRALKAGMTLARTLRLVTRFREGNDDTPILLMGYYNPIYAYGAERFLDDAKAAGVDGLIVVDLPPEEDPELCLPAREAGLDFIRLAAPTTDDARLPAVLRNASGFLYFVSITGVTGTASPEMARVRASLDRLRRKTDLPIAVGFGINRADQARAVAAFADAAVVGSAFSRAIEGALAARTERPPGPAEDAVEAVLALAGELAHGVRSAPREPASVKGSNAR